MLAVAVHVAAVVQYHFQEIYTFLLRMVLQRVRVKNNHQLDSSPSRFGVIRIVVEHKTFVGCQILGTENILQQMPVIVRALRSPIVA